MRTARELAVITHRMQVPGGRFETGVETARVAAARQASMSAACRTTATSITGALRSNTIPANGPQGGARTMDDAGQASPCVPSRDAGNAGSVGSPQARASDAARREPRRTVGAATTHKEARHVEGRLQRPATGRWSRPALPRSSAPARS